MGLLYIIIYKLLYGIGSCGYDYGGYSVFAAANQCYIAERVSAPVYKKVLA